MAGHPLVSLDRVDVHLWGADILRKVSLTLRAGESWAVVGGNGAGKSTLLRLLRGDEQPTPASRRRRRYALGRGAPGPSPIGARDRIGLVSPEMQDAYRRGEWDVPVEDAVRSGFSGEIWPDGPRSPAEERRIPAALERLGVLRLRHRSVLTLSTGELRRVLLARALVARPRLLLLDEPCDGLDEGSRRSFLAMLDGLTGRGPALVLATHRIEEIVPGIRRVAVLEQGRIVDQGKREEVMGRWMGRGIVATPTRTRIPTSTPTRTGTATATRAPGRTLLRVERADVHVDGHPVLHGVSFRVRAGEHWAVVGGNGAGKSTLLRLAVGDEQAMPGGKVARLGLGPRADVWEVKARVGLVTPELQARFRGDIRAEEVVLSGFTSSVGIDFTPSAGERTAVRAALRRVGAAHLAGRRIHSLSYGEMRRLLLARALLRDPELLVLDEPMNGLDRGAREALQAALGRLAGQGVTLLMATHHRRELPAAIGCELELAAGRVVYSGPRR